MKLKTYREIANENKIECPHCDSRRTIRIVSMKDDFGKYVCNNCDKVFRYDERGVRK